MGAETSKSGPSSPPEQRGAPSCFDEQALDRATRSLKDSGHFWNQPDWVVRSS